jgi:chromosome segregation ATPase
MTTVSSIAGVIGLLVGSTALLLQRFNDRRTVDVASTAGETAAKDVATKSMEAGARVLEQALERQDHDIATLRERVDALTEAVARCESEKHDLKAQLEAVSR